MGGHGPGRLGGGLWGDGAHSILRSRICKTRPDDYFKIGLCSFSSTLQLPFTYYPRIMSYTSYSHARLDRQIAPKRSKPRYVLKAPERQVAFRQELIAEEKTALVLKPQGDAHSENAIKITDQDGASVFIATGRKHNDRSHSCREVRDASGLPLFDIHKKPLSHPFSFVITLPGSKPSDAAIARATPQWTWNSINLDFMFRNGGEDRELSLTVQKHGVALSMFDVLDGDRRIADICESVTHNEKLALRRNSRGKKRRPALDLVIPPGMDMSLVRVSQWFDGASTNSRTGSGNCDHCVGLVLRVRLREDWMSIYR